ncbi:MAG: FliI/YscN family ATPase [candidate division Zixibacteria bacterium]|nr:FliI/YscN family ATPase [candidate division Zixibacteria bacterium]
MKIAYDYYNNIVDKVRLVKQYGTISRVAGLVVESKGPAVPVGSLCRIESVDTDDSVMAEVVGFENNSIFLMPLGILRGINPGSIVTSTGEQLRVPVGDMLLGRVLNGLGHPIDDGGPLITTTSRSLYAEPPSSLKRQRITKPLYTGIRSIDTLCTCGQGQRIGIFAGSGVGKSVMMGMITRGTSADVTVIGLIGERSREVKEFIENDLGTEGMKNAVVVAVTSDEPALIRLKGILTATTIAEYFRDQGKNVLLLVDSITRVAMAQREIGLSVGEPPATKGYPPSVFAMLPKILERSGAGEKGSITGLYTVLVEGDDFNEPISDAVRSVLDGHAILSRQMAAKNHYPAVDILQSVSRLMLQVTTPEHREAAGKIKEIMATYREAEDLINIGAYVTGSSKKIDHAIACIDKINEFLKQGIFEQCDPLEAIAALSELVIAPVSEAVEENEKV